jgi:6-pyruvoyltetrahydropterin/6-carboxytetrahydropterin synthase
MVRKDFIANHFLIGGDWGKECEPHAHRYVLDLVLEGRSLDANNYLVDILQVEEILGSVISRYRDKLLNDLPEFKGQNPSIELFSKFIAERLAEPLRDPRIITLRVTLWENESAWARYELSLK